MIDNPQNTSSAQGGSFDKGLSEDIKSSHKSPDLWTQARNAVNNTVVGDVGALSNEASNELCTSAPYTVIGVIHLTADEWAVFSTNDTNSEIGIFKEDSCDYQTVVNADCLNFSRNNLIKGVSKSTFDCAYQVYWDDGINPTRTLNLSDVPWVQECENVNGCQICTDTTVLDCEKIRLAPLFDDLSFRVEAGVSTGELLNGSYYVVGAYLVEGQRVTDYSLPSNVQPIFNHLNLQGSIDVYVEEADQSFDEFELIIVQFANFNTVARRFGVYSTRQKKITIDQIQENLPVIEVGDIVLNTPVIDKSDATYRNGDYLLRVGPSDKFDFNYQPLANQIISKWVSVEYDADYYRNGGSKTGHMRDEVYPFFIRFVWNTGDKTRSFHIPGRVATASDNQFTSGDDVLSDETDPRRWKIYNTASVDLSFPETGDILEDGGVVLGGGPMAYWESTEIYDDDKPEVWNASSESFWGGNPAQHDLCGRPIRHHKFPDNATDQITGRMITNHYDPDNGDKIRIMGVVFDNIKAPLDNEGNVIEGIVGYEILRGSRDGNKTVLAKGMINNTREYIPNDQGTNRRFLYPNYPYNPVKQYDRFLSETSTKHSAPLFKKNKDAPDNPSSTSDDNPALNNFAAFLDDDIPLGANFTRFPGPTYYRYNGYDYQNEVTNGQFGSNAVRDVLTFHSPETNFRDPFLSGKELKIYGELNGNVRGRFEVPKGHPKHKVISDTSFLVSSLIGIGYALIATEGARSRQYAAPKINYGGSYAQIGTSTGTTGLIGPSVVQSVLNAGTVTLSEALNKLTTGALESSLASLIGVAFGVNVPTIAEGVKSVGGLIAGAVGGESGQTTYIREESPWAATPGIIRFIAGIPAFLGFYAQGSDAMLDIIYAFTPYRQYALQYISHCFYDKYLPPQIGNTRRRIDYQSYLGPSFQDFTANFRINNLYRSRTVAVKIENNLEFTQTDDDTQVLFTERFGRGKRGINRPREYDTNYQNTEFDNGTGTTAASHYGAIKQPLDNQYGQIANIIQVPESTDATPLNQTRSKILMNGDIYIGRYTEKNTMHFFYDWLKDQPDGAEYDYRLRKNVVHPRFWLDSEKFDTGEFVSSLLTIFEGQSSSVPQDFDPFIKADPSSATPCDCSNTSPNCFFDSGDLDDLCECYTELEQDKTYVDFLEECAEWRVEEDGTDPSTLTEYNSTNCPECQSVNGGDCPSWKGFLGSVSEAAEKYTDEGKGKWGRKIKRAQRRLGRQQRKCTKQEEKLYDEYIEELTGRDDGNWFTNLFDGIITPNDKFGFDLNTPPRLRFTVKDGFFYLFNSGVRDFYVESEINVDLRDWGEVSEERHYDHLEYTDLRELFSSDYIKTGNFFKYDYSLSIGKLFNNFVSWGAVQDRDYDPYDAEKCFIYRPKRIVYSLPQNQENKKDFWRVFLPNNYRDFKSEPTVVKPIGKNGAMILFRNESPVQFAGVDTLQTDGGTKLTIGDGGLFSQPLQNLVNADDPHEYGSCQNRLSVVNTPTGLYYMSQNQGKIFIASGNGIQEISNQRMKWWFSKYLPYQLTKDFPDFELTDNPVIGIGCQAIFDNDNQVVFFCKKDYTLRKDIDDVVTYIGSNQFRVNGSLVVDLGHPRYFNNASWTVSYDPKTQTWVSYHDWHPDLTIPSKRTYMTTKDNGLWVHANRCDSYCNFYGIDYPFEVEFSLYTQTQVNTLRNIEYYMEVYKYRNNCDDRFHVLDFNFDEAVIYNSEQCSGLLRLNIKPKNNALLLNEYPRVNLASIDILFSKEEQKYRFNQFWDITDNRGEFASDIQRVIFDTEPNGYVRNLNPQNLNYNKFALERKKFRHYNNSVLLRRRVSGDKNMVITLALQKNLKSSR